LVRAVSGLFKPKHRILGTDVSGRVEAVGSNVSRFHIGDEVFGDLSRCGFGAFAEYVSVPEKEALILKPDYMTFEQAAAVPSAAVTALQALRNKGHIESGQNVLINGASGGVGSYAVQIAKSLGAEVTGVCSTGNVDMVSSLGTDHVIDYTKEDFSQNGLQYDLIHAANGYYSISQYKGALKPNGTYIMTGDR
jgi:NADPH:quinone reductase-like Zn-dependent oxidoreductase